MPDKSKVSVGKPKVGGAIYRAPIGTTLPTDATTTLATAFKELGYASEDGVVFSNEVEGHKAWGGDTVLSEVTETAKFKLIEVMNEDVLKTVYGEDNVSGALATGLTVARSLAAAPTSYVWVIETLMQGGVMKRIVIPSASVTELGDITYKDNELLGYEVTLESVADSAGNGHYEYIKAPAVPEG